MVKNIINFVAQRMKIVSRCVPRKKTSFIIFCEIFDEQPGIP